MNEQDVENVHGLVLALAEAVGGDVDGLWSHQLDREWSVAANLGNRRRQFAAVNCTAATLDPGQVAAWYNGWLAGFWSTDATLVTMLEGSLTQALEKELQRVVA